MTISYLILFDLIFEIVWKFHILNRLTIFKPDNFSGGFFRSSLTRLQCPEICLIQLWRRFWFFNIDTEGKDMSVWWNMFLKLCSFLSLMDSRFKVRSTSSRQQAKLFTISSVKRESWSNFRYFNFFGKYLLTSEYPKNAALPKSTSPSYWHCEREKKF